MSPTRPSTTFANLVLRTVLALLAGVLVVLAAPRGADRASADPLPEAALGGIVQLDAGQEHTCALLSTHRVSCWGQGFWGALGNGGTTSFAVPTPVSNPAGTGLLGGVTQVAAGGQFSCARLGSGQLRCWGYGLAGRLGNDATADQHRPVTVHDLDGAGPLTGVVQVDTGWDHACARLADGRAACWGANAQGQLGDGSTAGRLHPVIVRNAAGTGPLTGVRQVVALQKSTCARLAGGRVMCWGDNGWGQVGDGTTVDRLRPVLVRGVNGIGFVEDATQLAAGTAHACARLGSGQARCWGHPYAGQLGDGNSGVIPLHAVVVTKPSGAPLTGVRAVGAGGQHSCFVLGSGQVRCTGENTGGQLGDRTTTFRDRPVAMSSTDGTTLLRGALAVTGGGAHTCVRITGGRAICVGQNGYGQLGDAGWTATARPVGVRR